MNIFNKLPFKFKGSLFRNCWAFSRIKFTLPDLGEKIKEGTVKKLYVKQGDKVEEFQKIADVESDKQFTQITSPEEGVITRIHYRQTEVCKVGDLFFEFETGSTAQGSVPQKSKQTQKILKTTGNGEEKVKTNGNGEEKVKTNGNGEETLASGVVKMYAKAYGADISKVAGSGRNKRVLKEDIVAYIQKHSLKFGDKRQKVEKHQNIIPSRVPDRVAQTKTIKMNAYQQGMQKSMTAANRVPHLYLHEKVDVSELDYIRNQLKQQKIRVTMMGLLTKTFSLALLGNPRMNSTYDQSKGQFQFQTHAHHNISLAIDSPNGLVAPNIKNVENLSVLDIQAKINQLKTLSEEARLSAQYLQGGTICLSNIGTIAGISACPLVVFPQICIVAIGRTVSSPVFYNGSLHDKKFMTLSFGCDHRVIDGASVARFSNDWKNILENPYVAMAKMH